MPSSRSHASYIVGTCCSARLAVASQARRALSRSKPAGGDRLRHGDAAVGDGDFGASGDFGEEGAEPVFGFVDGDLYGVPIGVGRGLIPRVVSIPPVLA
jgi:hypothetical protein